jgi:hypothetical protein
MGYDGAMLLAAVILFLPITMVAGLLFAILQWLRCIPPGGLATPAYGLIISGGYALLFLGAAVDTFWVRPVQLQTEYLGRVYGTPLTLHSYDHSGFQDPVDDWVYVVDPNDIAELSKRCLPSLDDSGRCIVFSAEDLRSDASIWLEEDKLYIRDGLH